MFKLQDLFIGGLRAFSMAELKTHKDFQERKPPYEQRLVGVSKIVEDIENRWCNQFPMQAPPI
ncbi:MAG: hypothetical protein IJE62_01330 [Clostridia bacterium]|nr:hypothetical protein [Clostridia bacterium]